MKKGHSESLARSLFWTPYPPALQCKHDLLADLMSAYRNVLLPGLTHRKGLLLNFQIFYISLSVLVLCSRSLSSFWCANTASHSCVLVIRERRAAQCCLITTLCDTVCVCIVSHTFTKRLQGLAGNIFFFIVISSVAQCFLLLLHHHSSMQPFTPFTLVQLPQWCKSEVQALLFSLCVMPFLSMARVHFGEVHHLLSWLLICAYACST